MLFFAMSKDPKKSGSKTIASNREAFHRFTIFEKVEAGIVLTGTEVKSVRGNKLSFNDCLAEVGAVIVSLTNTC